MPQISLYSYEACPYAQRSNMVLLEKGIDFDLVEVDLYDRPDWWAALSPYGKVPLLKHGDAVIYESAIINEYLDDVFPEPPLLPGDAVRRAQARIWIDYCDSRFMPACHRLIADRRDEEKQIENRRSLVEVFRFLEAGIRSADGGPYWFGESVSLVDLQFAPFLERFACYQEIWQAEWPADCTALTAWFDAIKGLECWHATHHSMAFHMERYRKYDQAATDE